jgi:spore germination protein GerM
MPGKTTGGTRRKPAAKRTASRTVKPKPVKSSAGSRARKTSKTSTDKAPVYVLAIMALLTVIVVMLINNYKAGKNFDNSGTDPKKEVVTGKKVNVKKDKNEITKEKDGKEFIPDNKNNKEKIVSGEKEPETGEYLIYLVKFNENDNRMSLIPVKRNINADSPLKSTLNELIKGPNKTEKKKGLLTAIPDDLRIRNVQIIGKNAVLDFNDAIETNANGEILLTRIDQLVYTATQFEGIDNVIIKVNGRQKKFLGGDGLSVSGPIGRRGK